MLTDAFENDNIQNIRVYKNPSMYLYKYAFNG